MTQVKDHALGKFQNHTAHVAVIGLGYVGLPLCVAFARIGYKVTGIDLSRRKVKSINNGESYIEDITDAELAELVNRTGQGSFQATTDYSILSECDAVSICVETPLNKTGEPDIRAIVKSSEGIAEQLHPGMVIVLESTTYPGTTREVVLPRLSANPDELKIGEDFFLAFSPERIEWVSWSQSPRPMQPRCLSSLKIHSARSISALPTSCC